MGTGNGRLPAEESRQLIDKAGGVDALSKVMGVVHKTVREWARAGMPGCYVAEVRRAAEDASTDHVCGDCGYCYTYGEDESAFCHVNPPVEGAGKTGVETDLERPVCRFFKMRR